MIHIKKWGPVLLVLWPLLGWGHWTEQAAVPGGYCYAGSSMCHGMQEGLDYIWLMHGAMGEKFRLHRWRYDAWVEKTRMPQEESRVGPGGALAYVADPYAYIPSGGIFALKGNGSSEFYWYNTQADVWHGPPYIPSIPDAGGVTTGGALCFGGFHTRDGQLYADLYAFSGNEQAMPNGEYAGRFFRYSFPVVANSFALPGEWTELPSLYFDQVGYQVSAGAALSWYEDPAGTASGLGAVYALIGGGEADGRSLYKYDPAAGTWDDVAEFDYAVDFGGAMTAGVGDTLWCFRGGGSHYWWLYDVGAGTTTYFTHDPHQTWESQNDGAAMCFTGSNVFAEVGTDEGKFQMFDLVTLDAGGGQGHAVGIDHPMSVSVKARRNSHAFCVRNAAPGPVTLRIADASGRTMGSVHGRASAQTAELVWNTGAVNSGVYFYSVETPTASAVGKLVIAR